MHRAIPSEGYLADYVRFASSVTMAPPEYHLAGGLAQLAALMGNRIKFPLGGRDFPPHLWMVLLGPAGAARKSSAVSLAFDLLDQVRPGLRLPEESSREGLWEVLRNQPNGFLELSEFMSFMERTKLEYMRGITEDLCTFFDCPRSSKRQLKTVSYEVAFPSVTILGAGVTDVLSTFVRGKDLTGGFLSRFLLVLQTSPTNYVGMSPPAAAIGRDVVRRRLAEIASYWRLRVSYPYRMNWSRETIEAWESYDRRLIDADEIRIPETSGFVSRAGIYVAKIATCYALSRWEDGTDIDLVPEDVQQAIAFVDYCKAHTLRLIEGFRADTPDGVKMQTIRRLVRIHRDDDDWAPWQTVLRYSDLRKRDFEDFVNTMIASGQMEQDGHLDPRRRDRRLRLTDQAR